MSRSYGALGSFGQRQAINISPLRGEVNSNSLHFQVEFAFVSDQLTTEKQNITSVLNNADNNPDVSFVVRVLLVVYRRLILTRTHVTLFASFDSETLFPGSMRAQKK